MPNDDDDDDDGDYGDDDDDDDDDDYDLNLTNFQQLQRYQCLISVIISDLISYHS